MQPADPFEFTHQSSGSAFQRLERLKNLARAGDRAGLTAALATLERRAQKADACAHFDLARVYLLGLTGNRNVTGAMSHLTEAAKAGHSSAAFMLGTAFARGAGVPKIIGQAVWYFRLAAAHGHVDACLRLAEYAANGTGMPPSPISSINWTERAARLGHAESAAVMANAYGKAGPLREDTHHRILWLERAAAMGHGDAKWDLAHLRSTTPPRRAMTIVLDTARTNSPEALYDIYLATSGSPAGIDWLRRASAAGSELAAIALEVRDLDLSRTLITHRTLNAGLWAGEADSLLALAELAHRLHQADRSTTLLLKAVDRRSTLAYAVMAETALALGGEVGAAEAEQWTWRCRDLQSPLSRDLIRKIQDLRNTIPSGGRVVAPHHHEGSVVHVAFPSDRPRTPGTGNKGTVIPFGNRHIKT